MSQGSFINTQLQQLRTPLRTVDETNQYSQIADLVAKGLGLTAGVINAATNTQEQETALQNLENAKQAANARFVQSEQEAQDNLTMAGYKFESDELRQQAALQEADLPKMLEAAGGSYTKVLEQNPGLLRPVRNKVQNILAQNQAETDLAQFRAMVILNPTKNVQDLAANFIKLKQNSYPEFDQETRGQYFSYVQDAINRDIALKTVQNAEIQRRDAVDAGDQQLLDNLTAASQGGLLDKNTFDFISKKYISDALSIDNRRSETALRIQSFNAIKQVVIGQGSSSPFKAIEEYNKLFPGAKINPSDPLAAVPEDATEFGDEMSRSLALALRQDVLNKYNAYAAKIKDNFTAAIAADETLAGRVSAKHAVDAANGAQIPEKIKLEINQFNINDTTNKLQSQLDASNSEEELAFTFAQIEQAHNANLINDIPYQSMLKKKQELSLTFKAKSDVNAIVTGATGSNLIQLTSEHDKWINQYTDGLMQPIQTFKDGQPVTIPGLSVGDAYAKTVSLFGRLTPDQLQGLNGLANNPPVSTGDPQRDGQIRFQRNIEAADAFQKLYDAAPSYVNGLLSKDVGGLSPKMLAISSAVIDQGRNPTDVALWIANVPSSAFTDAINRWDKPDETKGIDGGIITIQKAYGSSFIPQSWDWTEPDLNGISPSVNKIAKGLYVNHYAQIWSDSQGGLPPDTIAKQAFEQTQSDLRNFTVNADIGNFNSVIANKTNPLSVAGNYEATEIQMKNMNRVWSDILHRAEMKYENIRYTKANLDFENIRVSSDGKDYEIPVYNVGQAGGRNTPIATFLYPINEQEQKALVDIFSDPEYFSSFNTGIVEGILSIPDEVFNGPQPTSMKKLQQRDEEVDKRFKGRTK